MEMVWPNNIEKGSLIWALLIHMLISCSEVLAQSYIENNMSIVESLLVSIV